jgi:hypothetical protein
MCVLTYSSHESSLIRLSLGLCFHPIPSAIRRRKSLGQEASPKTSTSSVCWWCHHSWTLHCAMADHFYCIGHLPPQPNPVISGAESCLHCIKHALYGDGWTAIRIKRAWHHLQAHRPQPNPVIDGAQLLDLLQALPRSEHCLDTLFETAHAQLLAACMIQHHDSTYSACIRRLTSAESIHFISSTLPSWLVRMPREAKYSVSCAHLQNTDQHSSVPCGATEDGHSDARSASE